MAVDVVTVFLGPYILTLNPDIFMIFMRNSTCI